MDTQHDNAFNWNEIYSGTAADYDEPDRLVVESTVPLPVGRGLDVGCGAGGLVVALARRGWAMTGIDVAQSAVAAARCVMDKFGLSAELQQADAANWQPAARYDLITNCFALPSTKTDQAAAMAMMKSALAPGGTVVIKDFDASMHRYEHFAGFYLPTLDELVQAFDGFEIARAEIVETPSHHASDDKSDPWTAAFLVARRPAR